VSDTSLEISDFTRLNGLAPEVLLFAKTLDIEVGMPDADGPNMAVFDIMAQILGAEDEDAVFEAADAGLTSGKEFKDIPFRIRREDITWKRSATQYTEHGQFPFYAMLRVSTLKDGEVKTISCGGATFCAVLYKLQKLDAFAKYEEDGGLPMVITGKPAGIGEVLIPRKYFLPTTHAKSASK
jgi:hypothetical protein